MRCNKKMLDIIEELKSLPKPEPFVLDDVDNRTPEEIEVFVEKLKYAESLGINVTTFYNKDIEHEFDEDIDKELAYTYIMNGEEIPTELLNRILYYKMLKDSE